VPHRRRPFLDARHPVHVSTRVVGGLPSLRGRALWAAVRRGFVFGRVFRQAHGSAGRLTDVFRIVHYSVQGQHIHLICEARDRTALARGIQAFKIRVARAVNAALGRRGAVFEDRYHQRIITNPTQCRHTIAYVLLNQRHHAYEAGASYPPGRVDPCSSATEFDGWTVQRPKPWATAPPTDTDDQPMVARPTTWLLRGGWKRARLGRGERAPLLSPDAIPGLPPGAPPLPVW
jgi:REP element-mobilizing transposase RayT